MERRNPNTFDLYDVYKQVKNPADLEKFVALLAEGLGAYVPHIDNKVYASANYISLLINEEALVPPQICCDALQINFDAYLGSVFTPGLATSLIYSLCVDLQVDATKILGITRAGKFDPTFAMRMFAFLAISAEVSHAFLDFLLERVRLMQVAIKPSAVIVLPSLMKSLSRNHQRLVAKAETSAIRQHGFEFPLEVENAFQRARIIDQTFNAVMFRENSHAIFARHAPALLLDGGLMDVFTQATNSNAQEIQNIHRSALRNATARPILGDNQNLAHDRTKIFMQMCFNQTPFDFYRKILKQEKLSDKTAADIKERMHVLRYQNGPIGTIYTIFSQTNKSKRKYQFEWCRMNRNLFPNFDKTDYDLPNQDLNIDPHNFDFPNRLEQENEEDDDEDDDDDVNGNNNRGRRGGRRGGNGGGNGRGGRGGGRGNGPANDRDDQNDNAGNSAGGRQGNARDEGFQRGANRNNGSGAKSGKGGYGSNKKARRFSDEDFFDQPQCPRRAETQQRITKSCRRKSNQNQQSINDENFDNYIHEENQNDSRIEKSGQKSVSFPKVFDGLNHKNGPYSPLTGSAKTFRSARSFANEHQNIEN